MNRSERALLIALVNGAGGHIEAEPEHLQTAPDFKLFILEREDGGYIATTAPLCHPNELN